MPFTLGQAYLAYSGYMDSLGIEPKFLHFEGYTDTGSFWLFRSFSPRRGCNLRLDQTEPVKNQPPVDLNHF